MIEYFAMETQTSITGLSLIQPKRVSSSVSLKGPSGNYPWRKAMT